MLLRLRITTSTAGAARRICDRLAEGRDAEVAALATALFESAAAEGWQADAYYAEMPDRGQVLALIADLLLEATSVSFDPVPDENWVAISQAALPPVRMGRFVVHGAHDRARIGLRQWAIEIDAGEAFGTAHHATTQGCLLALDWIARRRNMRRVLDLGCGSGVLAIAAARLWPAAHVSAGDIDAQATAVARSNMALNRAEGRIRVATAMGLDHPLLRSGAPYDLIVANILAGPLVRLAPTLARASKPGGLAVLSGLLGEQVREVAGSYVLAGFHILRISLDHNWATLVLTRQGKRVVRGAKAISGRPASWPGAPRSQALDWAQDGMIAARRTQPQ